jgi:TPR repeat protein/serine/threonine protein kinase
MIHHLQPNTTLQGGKYRIERVLGQGGFGITYLAVQTSDNRQVAIKELFLNGVNERVGNAIQVSNSVNNTLFEKQKEKFNKEAKRIMSLDNDHIVKVYELFEENNTVYYVMDYLEGESLASRMKREGHPLTESEVMDILPQLLDALSEIHKFQIWHLDIKPANIMLIDKTVVLIDFGASKQITPSEMTSTALYFTPGYAPAEQTGMLFNQFGPWTDLYAVGATIFNLLTGKSPLEFDIEEFKEDDLPESNLGLMYKMINWMMQPRRKDRPQKAEDVKQKYYADFVSIGVVSILKEIFNKEIVKTIGEDIDIVKDLGATQVQIDTFKKEVNEVFGVDLEGCPMTHDFVAVTILQQLGWLFDIGNENSEEVTEEEVDEWNNLVEEQNKILEDRNEETVVSGGGKVDNNMTVEEMVSLINSDNQKGLETVRGIANSGNADAQLLVGIMYHMGIAGEEHQSDAAYYFRMAAEQGLASAQTNLGKCYLAGDGVPEDDKKAFEWFEKAASQGDAEGQFQLGRCYEEGWGTEKIENLAYQYYSKSANQGYANAQIQVGFCYLDGIGVSANDSGAFEWFKKAAEQDNPDGQYLLGACYAEGTGVTKDSQEAVKWYKKAAEQGIATAQYNLGICYLEGDGVPKSRSEAKRLFQKAAEQGHEDAKKALQYIEQQTNQNSSYTNNLSGDESTIIDRSGHETTTVTSQPNSTSTTNSSDSQSGGSEKWYIIWVIFLTILCIWGGCTNRWIICAIGGVGLFVSGWVKTLFFDK